MIGKDFPPNDFVLFGLNFTDPTDFIYDTILGLVSLYFAFRIHKFEWSNLFYKSWYKFFFYFGAATLFSAFGHLLYNYFFYIGKIPGWVLVPVSMYWIEKAMIEAHWNRKYAASIKQIYLAKLLLVYSVCFITWLNVDPYLTPQFIFLPIAINTMVGLLIGVGSSSFVFKNKLNSQFKYILYGVLVIFPSAFIFILKINLHQWFSKNDFSHILMLFGIAFFFYSVLKLNKSKFNFEKKIM